MTSAASRSLQRGVARSGAATSWALTLLLLGPACALSEQQQDDWQEPDSLASHSMTALHTPEIVPADAGAPGEDGGGGCVAETEQELCALYSSGCGEVAGFDSCGDWREVGSCGSCAADQHCVGGACLAWSYTWITAAWGTCSASCGGGTRARDVLCQREDGALVADLFCTGPPPQDSETCNTNPCVNCALISAANPTWEVCETGPSYCAGVFGDGHSGTTCHDFCAAVGLPCTMRRGGEPGCIKESTTFACGVDNGHNSDWCECGTP